MTKRRKGQWLKKYKKNPALSFFLAFLLIISISGGARLRRYGKPKGRNNKKGAEIKMSIGKTVGVMADKMLKLTGKAVKKLEDYGNQSAEENNNENARKLAAAMNKLGKKLEDKHDQYVASVEQNADDLAEKGKEAISKLKHVYEEMRTRADTAKEKAENDAKKDAGAADGDSGNTPEDSGKGGE